jgi:membrane associated rhomboid family serine protease
MRREGVTTSYLSDRGQLVAVDIEDVPWATALLMVWMVGLYLYDPTLDTFVGYYFLSPWTHGGFEHFWNNMVFLIPLGLYVERRVGSSWFLAFSFLSPYFALHLSVLLGLSGLTEGASGLTKALTGYSIPVLFAEFFHRLDGLRDGIEWREVAVAVVAFAGLVILLASARLTVLRFVGLESSPRYVSVGSHLLGLVAGLVWFVWRAWRHGLDDV